MRHRANTASTSNPSSRGYRQSRSFASAGWRVDTTRVSNGAGAIAHAGTFTGAHCHGHYPPRAHPYRYGKPNTNSHR